MQVVQRSNLFTISALRSYVVKSRNTIIILVEHRQTARSDDPKPGINGRTGAIEWPLPQKWCRNDRGVTWTVFEKRRPKWSYKYAFRVCMVGKRIWGYRRLPVSVLARPKELDGPVSQAERNYPIPTEGHHLMPRPWRHRWYSRVLASYNVIVEKGGVKPGGR